MGNKKHRHTYILKRRVVQARHVVEFYECINPGCPERDKMVIKPRKGKSQ